MPNLSIATPPPPLLDWLFTILQSTTSAVSVINIPPPCPDGYICILASGSSKAKLFFIKQFFTNDVPPAHTPPPTRPLPF